MRERFRGYYRPSDDEFDDLWAEAMIVVDANVLLNLYRYSLETQEDLLGILRAVRDRLWLPYQAGLEFHLNRLKVMTEQRAVYGRLAATIEDARRTIEQSIRKHNRHPVLDVEDACTRLNHGFESFMQYLTELEGQHPELPTAHGEAIVDPVLAAVTEIFDGSVGARPSTDHITESHKEADQRYEREIPPGFRDVGKDGQRQYGDFLIWKEILARSADVQKPALFVTDDSKDDWWNVFNGQTIGPRPELIEEFWDKTGFRFHMYRSDQFMRWAKRYVGSEVSEEAVEEVRDVATKVPAAVELLRERRSELETHLRRVNRMIVQTREVALNPGGEEELQSVRLRSELHGLVGRCRDLEARLVELRRRSTTDFQEILGDENLTRGEKDDLLAQKRDDLQHKIDVTSTLLNEAKESRSRLEAQLTHGLTGRGRVIDRELAALLDQEEALIRKIKEIDDILGRF